MAPMNTNRFHHLIPIAAMAFLAASGPAWAATGTISASPNPCRIAPGSHNCGTEVTWSTQGVKSARVYVQKEGQGTAEREFGNKTSCDKCTANWIEPGVRYTFTLVDFSTGGRGATLGTVTVSALEGAASGVIKAAPNPCRLAPGKLHCTTVVTWSTQGVQQARVMVAIEGAKSSPEREFALRTSCDNCPADWITEGSRHTFTLYDWSTGSRGKALASVVVTAVK